MRSTMRGAWRDLLRFVPLSLAALFVLAAGECEDDETSTGPETDTGTFRITLDHVVAGAPLEQNQLLYATADGDSFRVNKLVWVLSLIEVGGGHGRELRRHVEGPEVHLRDAFHPDSRVIEIADVPPGTYTGVTFVFGLNEHMNAPGVTYTQPGFEDAWVDMDWPATWGDGYHYMKLEGFLKPESGGLEQSLLTHLGRRNAQNDPTFGTDPEPAPHFFEVTLPFEVTVAAGDVWEIPVIMDVAEWYTNPHDVDLEDPAFARMIMMNTPVQDVYEENGASVFSLGTIEEVD